MARISRTDQAILDEADNLIRLLRDKAGLDRSILQVLEEDPKLFGEITMLANIFNAVDHLTLEHTMLSDLIIHALDKKA